MKKENYVKDSCKSLQKPIDRSKHGTVMRTEITCKKIYCYMSESVS